MTNKNKSGNKNDQIKEILNDKFKTERADIELRIEEATLNLAKLKNWDGMMKLQIKDLDLNILGELSDDERFQINQNAVKDCRDEGRIDDGVKYFFDFTRLQAGDLILKLPTKPDGLQKWIQADQKREFGDEVGEHWRFSHAMISRGGDELYEAHLKSGVTRTTFWKTLLEKNEYKIMRVPNKKYYNRVQIAINAAELTGRKYDIAGALVASRSTIRKIFTFRNRDRDDQGNSYFCSSLYAAACYYEGIDLGLGVDGEELNPRVVSPAALSSSKLLEEVEVPVLRIDDYL